MPTILLAGGAGYVGSHTAVELLNDGYDVVVLDNFSNSTPETIKRIETITGKLVRCYKIDVRDKLNLSRVFKENNIDAVINMMRFKSIDDSTIQSIWYYKNNIDMSLSLLETMVEIGVSNIIFSSSITVYGENNTVPFLETMQRSECTNNIHSLTKSVLEQMIENIVGLDDSLSLITIRYANPTGAHESGMLGDNLFKKPDNLMSSITQVAVGKQDKLIINGSDYPTKDGTCTRDYVHVVDVAIGYVKAVKYILKNKGCREIFNLGTGIPCTVKELVETFQRVNKVKFDYEYGPQRKGDLSESFVNSEKIQNVLGWKPSKSLEDMCRDSWNWQNNIKNGYLSKLM